MDYARFVRNLELPPGFTAPTRLTHDDLVATMLGRADLHEDVRGINASIELIRWTRGGGWSTEPVTEDFDYVDLVWHECEFHALQRWVAEAFPFEAPHYSNVEIPIE